MEVLVAFSRFLIKVFISLLTALAFVLVGIYLLGEIFDASGIIYPLVGFWALIAYVVLPRVHRFLTRIYLPDYYIGRTKTGEGFYGDPINLAFLGSERKLHRAMKDAGWSRAEEITLSSALKMFNASVRKKSYKTAPVSSLFLFGRKQDFAYQQEVNGNPRVRHHVRFWKVPKNWWLPGGYEADWLAAATFDKSVGLSLYTGQITHKITDDTDTERDYVVETVAKTKHIQSTNVVEKFSTAFRSRNGGGDHIMTDGALPFVHLKDK